MDLFFDILKKGLVATIFVIFGFVATYVPQPFNQVKTVEAGIVFDPTNFVQNTSTAISTTANWIKENVLDGIGNAIAKRLISSMLGSMVRWINSGFSGSPAFIQDIGGFLLQVADEAAGDVIESLGEVGSFICSPFRLDIQIALSLKYQQAREGRPLATCTLTGVIDNLESFIEGNFQDGGWEDWFAITSQPELYTPYGQMLAAEAHLSAQISNQRGQRLQIANWGNGFLSSEVCEYVDGPDGEGDTKCSISTPGTTIANSLNKALGAGQDALVSADEINEVIGALLGQIANQALTGAAGLLGLSAGTGYTAPGFQGGSFLGQMNSESNSTIDTSNLVGQINSALNTQNSYNNLAAIYRPQLAAYQFSPGRDDEKVGAANQAALDAADIQSQTAANITTLTPLLTEAQALETEFNQPATTNARKIAIKDRQVAITNTFYSLRLYSDSEMRGSETTWRAILQ